MTDKVRIRKYQQPRVGQWADALEIPQTRFVEDAINFYLKHLEGKLQVAQTLENTDFVSIQPQTSVDVKTIEDIEDPDTFTGGIEL